jgi:hypothetical protein
MKNLGASLQAILLKRGGGQPQVKYQASHQTVATEQTTHFNFDAGPVGGLPQGAQVFSGQWVIRVEPDAPSPPNVLCQTGIAQFPAIALSDAVYADVVVSVRFKPISGRIDQAAGIIFRVQDRDNYYILRANALEGNVNIYKYASGKRSRIQRANAKVLTGVWQELRVEVRGNHLHGYLNGQLVNEGTDDSYPAGQVGLWTKADSATCFDDMHIKALKKYGGEL